MRELVEDIYVGFCLFTYQDSSTVIPKDDIIKYQ